MAKAGKRVVKKGKSAYNRPEEFPVGTEVKDVLNNHWEISEKIGQGGFGDVYSAKKVENTDKKQTVNYVIKIEPKENGPLFTEMHFYIKFFKPDIIKAWKKENNLIFLGVPCYYGSGSCMRNGISHRFLVMNRFGENILTKLLHNRNKQVNCTRLSTFSQQIIDSLHYIHSKGYAHGDIKAENLLLAHSSNVDEIYLIDYGLVTACYKLENIVIDKKRQHNGTLLYCSRDAHLGIVTKRGDMETLGYNILSWFNYKLPWFEDTKPEIVQKKKIQFMDNLKVLDEVAEIPVQIKAFLQYTNTLNHLQAPDYKKMKELFKQISTLTKSVLDENVPQNITAKKSVYGSDRASGERVTKKIKRGTTQK